MVNFAEETLLRYSDEIKNTAIIQLYDYTAKFQLALIIPIGLLLFGYQNASNKLQLYSWAIIFVGYTILSSAVMLFFKQKVVSLATEKIENLIAWDSFLLSLFFVAGTLISFPKNGEDFSIIILALNSCVMGGIITGALSLKSYFVWAVPIMLTLAVSFFLWIDDSTFLVIGQITGIPIMLYLAWVCNRLFMNMFALQFQNRHLLEASEQANIAKSRFIATASHDLRQPLHAIELFVSSLESKPESRSLPEISRIRTSLDYLSEMFNSLIHLSKIDAGIIKVNKTHFPLQKILNELNGYFQLRAEQQNIKLDIQESNAWLYTDSDLLKRILFNILENAFRYTPKGQINVKTRKKGAYLEISICDTGIGISSDQKEKIFQEFFHGSEHKNGSLGLGLAIVEQLSKLLKIKIHVDSELDKGSCFRVTVEQGEEQHFTEKQNTAVTTPDQAGNLLNNKTVYVLDDDKELLDGMQLMIKSWGAKVDVAQSSKKLFQLFDTKGAPDLLLIDLYLGEKQDGIEIIANLPKSVRDSIKIIVITAETGKQQLKELDALGVPVLYKPVKSARLRALMTQLFVN